MVKLRIKFINKNYVFTYWVLQTQTKQMKCPVFESNWIPFLENENILAKKNKTLFSILGQLGLLHNLGYSSKCKICYGDNKNQNLCPVTKFIDKNYVFASWVLQTQIVQWKLPVFESNWIPFLGENEDILTKLDKTLFSVLGHLGQLNHLGYASKRT